MKSLGQWQAKIGCLFTFVLVLFVSGCGGGSGGSTSGGGSTPASVQTLNADAGDIIGIRVGDTANLDGSASSAPTSGSLTYAWSFTHKPETSKTAVLINANTANPSFVPDVIGSYMVQLIVTSDGISSKRAIALVEASVSGNLTGNVRVHTSFSSRCSSCHDGRYLNPIVNPGFILPKSGSHVGASNVCEACHTTFGFKKIRYVDHNEVFGNCSSCHNGVQATGKSAIHVQTTSECDVCHNTTSFLTLVNGKYDHTGITSGCTSCHDGKIAIGTNHNPDTFEKSNNDCVFCHNTTTFTGAFPNHNVILADVTAGTDRCDRCHGVTTIGPISGHPDISNTSKLITNTVDCSVCHSIKQFSLNGVFAHRVDASVVACEVCHTEPNTINAIGTASFPASLPPGQHGNTNGNDCGVCHGTSIVRSFKNTIIDHSATDVVAQRCDVCHDGAGTALHKSTNHINTKTTPSVTDCNACHTPGSFASGTFDHSMDNMLGLTCSGCHNNTNSVGKIANHIPTTLECDSCHTANTPTTPSTFRGTLFHPTNTPTSCNSCHDGVIQKGKNITHLATVRDCSNCHTTATPLTFVGGTYDHADPGVSTSCASCHDGVRAIDKTNNGTKSNHIPAQNECSECHSDTTVTGGFANNLFLTNVHPNQVNGCEGCHTAKYLSVTRPNLLKSASTKHVPTTQDCHLCHSNVNFADTTQFTHAGISGNCESCHNGTYYSVGVGPKAKGKANPTPAITHTITTSDCGSCHAIGKGFTDGKFDHTGIVNNCASCHDGPSATGPVKNLGHVVTQQDCSICHVPGTFKTTVFNHDQIVSGCVSCHDGSGAKTTKLSVPPPRVHVSTTKDCYECHNKIKFAGATYDHTVINNDTSIICASCHDGAVARGKDGTHVPTGDDCRLCHETTGMKPARFYHTGINNNCTSCHDGIFASDKKIGHVATTLDCGSCHSVPKAGIIANGPTNGWIPATHVAVANGTRCDSCHGDGGTATGTITKTNPVHWAFNTPQFDCRDCHTTAGFKPGKWLHSKNNIDNNSVNNCDSCHSPAGGARDKTTAPGGHITTTSQCDECHTTTAWAPAVFSHDPNKLTQDGYPGDHNAAPPCGSCHGNSIGPITNYPSTLTYLKPLQSGEINPNPYCAACHEGNFKPNGDHNGGSNGTVKQNQNCASSGCHNVGQRTFN